MKTNNRNFILAAIFSAVIVLMTIIPYLGYITYGPVEITTLHIIVIIGAIFLGWKYGAVLGGVWGITCVMRAMVFAAANPIFKIFVNPFVSFVPRLLVGIVAGVVFMQLKKRIRSVNAAIVAAIAGTITNTLLVLSAMYFFGDMIKGYSDIFQLIKTIMVTLISVNGGIELVAAIIVVPVVYSALARVYRS